MIGQTNKQRLLIYKLNCVKIDKRRAAMDKFREYREKHVIEYADTIEDRLALRFVKYKFSFFTFLLT